MIPILNQIQEELKKSFVEFLSNSQNDIYINSINNESLITATNNVNFGDFQSNYCLILGKLIKQQPREVAKEIEKLLLTNNKLKNTCTINIAGPGFINFTIKKEVIIKRLIMNIKDKKAGISSLGIDNKGTILIDFSSPNIAKQMHVGHLRSTIIGDTIAKILEFRGYKVLRINHIGDWGTQFGMLIAHLKDEMSDSYLETSQINIEDLVAFYRCAKKRFDDNLNFKKKAREEVVKLQNKNPLSIKAWKILCEKSREEFHQIYNRLGIKIKERGESFYNDMLSEIVNELEEKKMAVLDKGAKCIFINQGANPDNNSTTPVIIQKSDGGYNYATTDLAAIKYRFSKKPNGDNASKIIYVTDSGQASHFKGVFKIAELAEWIPPNGQLIHVPFGLVHGTDGKKFKTRSGSTIKLKDLLDEAVSRAKKDLKKRLDEDNKHETDEFIQKTASIIGHGSVKYADLSQNRQSNYQFDFDKMLALNGNTAPYLLYALVRISGINRKGGKLNKIPNDLIFDSQIEWDLIKKLIRFDEIIIKIEKDLLPNRLCTYLFELCQMFNRFYDQSPILSAPNHIKDSRLAICLLTENILKIGLDLLGIEYLERM
tara:strand:+ start:25805 stop:27604 length:1800 start_codon:yes stop_codon:yes gene_type:complete